MTSAESLRGAVWRILRPLVRLLIARGFRFPEASDIIKEIYIDISAHHFAIEGKRLTDSRISLLTGLQRKDVKAVRGKLDAEAIDFVGPGHGPLPRVLAQWTGTAAYTDEQGSPIALAPTGDAPSFATLVAEVSRDVHPRTILDELTRLGLAHYDVESGLIALFQPNYVPSRDESSLLGYFGANVGDHCDAAAQNLLAAPEPGPFFERAVHYNQLSKDSIDELEKLARKLQSATLSKINTRALELQTRDAKTGSSSGRFRCGAYFYRAPDVTSKVEN